MWRACSCQCCWRKWIWTSPPCFFMLSSRQVVSWWRERSLPSYQCEVRTRQLLASPAGHPCSHKWTAPTVPCTAAAVRSPHCSLAPQALLPHSRQLWMPRGFLMSQEAVLDEVLCFIAWMPVFITELEMPLYPPSWHILWHAAGALEQLPEDSSSLPMSFLNFIVLLAEARMLCKSKFQLAELMSGHGSQGYPSAGHALFDGVQPHGLWPAVVPVGTINSPRQGGELIQNPSAEPWQEQQAGMRGAAVQVRHQGCHHVPTLCFRAGWGISGPYGAISALRAGSS